MKKNTEYKLEITDHIVLKSNADSNNITDYQVLDSTVSTAAPQSFDIKTGFLTFGNLMSGSNAEINDIITDYTPRRINVTAPIRYIDELKIIHKRQASVQSNTTESVTNIDISVNDKAIDNTNGDVKSISVTPIVNGVPLPQQAKEIDHLNAVQNDW